MRNSHMTHDTRNLPDARGAARKGEQFTGMERRGEAMDKGETGSYRGKGKPIHDIKKTQACWFVAAVSG